jgi:hypothetical protein
LVFKTKLEDTKIDKGVIEKEVKLEYLEKGLLGSTKKSYTLYLLEGEKFVEKLLRRKEHGLQRKNTV